MARIKRFQAVMQVSGEFLREYPTAMALVADRLRDQLGDEGRGPRGGRYKLFGPTEYDVSDTSHDFAMDIRFARATRLGRYVRP